MSGLARIRWTRRGCETIRGTALDSTSESWEHRTEEPGLGPGGYERVTMNERWSLLSGYYYFFFCPAKRPQVDEGGRSEA